MHRRDLVRSADAAAAMSAVSYHRVLDANDGVSLGFVGLGNRGDQVLEHGDSKSNALCDNARRSTATPPSTPPTSSTASNPAP